MTEDHSKVSGLFLVQWNKYWILHEPNNYTFSYPCCNCLVAKLCLTFTTPWTAACSCRIPWPLCPWDFPGKNTGVGFHFLLQGFPDPGIKTMSPTLAGGFFTTEPPGNPTHLVVKHISLSILMSEYSIIYHFHCTLCLDSYCVDGFHKQLARIS